MSWFSEAMDGGGGVAQHIANEVTKATAPIGNAINSAGQVFTNITGISVGGVKIDLETGQVSIDAKLQIAGIQGDVALSIRFDPQTSSFNGSTLAVAGQTVALDPTNVAAAIDDAITHSLDWVPNFGVVKRVCENDYQDIYDRLNQQYGAGNVYLASRDFVSWLCPTTVGKAIVALVASGGAATKVIESSFRSRATREAKLIQDWLAPKIAANLNVVTLVQNILNGQDPTALLPELALGWQNIEYRSWIKILGNAIPATTIGETHWGFAIIWTPAGTPVNFTPLSSNSAFVNEDQDAPPSVTKWRFGIKPQYTTIGCAVIYLVPGSPADQAGIKQSETIVAIDGQSVGNINGQHYVFWRVLERSVTGKVTATVLDQQNNTRNVLVQCVPN